MSLSSQEKHSIKNLFPAGPFHIYYATVAKLYLARQENAWTDTGVVGAVVFLRDHGKGGSFFLRFVTLPDVRVVWEQEMYVGFTYSQDRPFFHSFATDTMMAGLSFADEQEAAVLLGKIQRRDAKLSMANQGAASAKTATSASLSSPAAGKDAGKGKKKKLDKSLIGAPTNFRHLTHIGWDAEKGGFSAVNIPPEWKSILHQAGVTDEQLRDKQTAKFIYDFMASNANLPNQQQQPPPPPQPSSRPPVSTPTSRPPPPPAPSRTPAAAPSQSPGVSRRGPPPPPPRRNTLTQQDAPPLPPSASRPPPPPLPNRAINAVSSPPPTAPPPPMPPRSSGPSSPIDAPMSGSAPPPPPPPPASFPSPPPPQAPPVSSSAPSQPSKPKQPSPVSDARSDLLASIRNAAGGQKILRPVSERPVSHTDDEAASSGNGGDLASALRMALNSRQVAMKGGDSDEGESGDEESDDEW